MTDRGYPKSLVPSDVTPTTGPGALALHLTFAAQAELRECMRMLQHCTGQLTADQVWNRPGSEQNAIGNLLLHLEGNLRQWVVIGLAGGEDHRNRPAEFAERDTVATSVLMQRLDACVSEAVTVLNSIATAEALLQPRRIQGFNMTGVAALQHTISHFRGHTQEIVGRTRQLLGEKYRFAWMPQTPEQGAVP